MSGDSDGNKEFHEQLRLQQLYEQRREGGEDPHTYVDPEDGTVYDWDHEKRAWFPKVSLPNKILHLLNNSVVITQSELIHSKICIKVHLLFVSFQVNDDFIAAYQANYGFNEEGAPDPSAAVPVTEFLPAKPEEPKKLEESSNQEKTEGAQKGEKRKADPGQLFITFFISSIAIILTNTYCVLCFTGWFEVEKDKNTNVYVSGK